MSLQTFEQLRKIVEPVLVNYQDDLLTHDYHTLKEYDGPFVYGYRRTGTDLLLMRSQVDDYSWKLPITIEEIDTSLKESFIWIDYQSRNTHFLHFDGRKLIRRSSEDLRTIWSHHVSKVVKDATQRIPGKAK
jgi:hypothetical protein